MDQEKAKEPIRPPRLNKPIEVTVSLSCKIKAHNDWRRWFFVLINTTSLIEIPGCAIVEGKFVVLLDQQSAKLLIYNIDGSFNRDIRLSGKPQRLSIIDDNLVAISYNRLFIELIIIKTGELSMKIFTSAHSLDIAFQNGHLFIVEDMGKIEVTDIRGIIMRTIHCPSSNIQYIATDKNMMFLSDSKNNSLYCCDFNGSVIWKFVNPLMEYPCGVTTDGSCNVYVTCHKSSNVFVVSSHGKQHQVLLCEKEQHSPSGIYYDKTNNRLLVCSMSNRNVFLYNVNHAANGQESLSDASN